MEDFEDIPSKKFKDLKPENRKKRKEPQKAWGRRERLFTLFVFLATILTPAILAMSARKWKLPGLPRFALEETIIIGGKGSQEKSQMAIKLFKEETKNLSGLYALSVIRLKDGSSYGVNEKETMIAASLIKLPILATLYKEVERGNLTLDTKYALKNSDKRPGSGSLASKPTGTVLTYRELAELMGKQSDNTAFNIIRRVLGDEKINQEIHDIGMTDTSLEDNKTTPYDIGLFFSKLWKNEIVSKKSRDEILDFLTDTIYENWIVEGIPKDIRVAHKYGREARVVNDAGIVFSNNPFVLVIMTDGVVEREADQAIPVLTKKIYELESGPN